MKRRAGYAPVRSRVWWWLARTALTVAGWAAAAAAAAAAVWPLTLVTAAGYGAAWLSGWPPARLWRAAAWSLPMTGVWLLAAAISHGTWQGVALAPVRDWRQCWHLTATGNPAAAFLVVAPVAVPAGLALAGLGWAHRRQQAAIAAGLGRDDSPTRPWSSFDARQWRRQARTAAARIAAPGAVPLLTGRDTIPVGGTIRTIGHRWRPVLSGRERRRSLRHMVIVGATGSGKTNLMMRLWAGWSTAALAARRRGGTGAPAPLLVVVDCKGGRDAREKAARTRRLLYGAGARRVAIWPDEARLSIWDLPPADLAVLLYQMIESGTGAAAYYADMLYACVVLAVTAPPGPPYNTASFLDRLDAGLAAVRAWGDGRTRAGRPGSQSRPGTCPTSSSATPPCWTGSAPRWTAPAPWPRRTPGTASWKAPASRRWPRRRRWRSPS